MPITAFGFDLPDDPKLGKSVRKYIFSNALLKRLSELQRGREFFVFSCDDCYEIYAFSENDDQVQNEILQHVNGHGVPRDRLNKYSFSEEGYEAIYRFYSRAVGLRGQAIFENTVQSFRLAFSKARSTDLIGPHFSRLYQRGIWLAEKIRLELRQQKSSTRSESVVLELAQKIFGDLSEHSALVASRDFAGQQLLQRLHDTHIERLLVWDFGGSGLQTISEKYNAVVVNRQNQQALLPDVDLFLIFDEACANSIKKEHLDYVMHRRKNAPVLWLSLFDEANPAQSKQELTAYYNLYYYGKDDLDAIVTDNLRETQKKYSLVHQFIKKETEAFMDWVDSKNQYRFGDIIGRSRAMQKILELIARISQSDISVLIDGESGTGKELISRAIHEHSSRAGNAFVVVNCGAIPESLLESELFGHLRGAFTGATSNKMGLLEVANNGTIFLDEIGETTPSTQVKLLRFLQEGEIKPVGSNQTLKLQVRVIAATNRDLLAMVNEGQFRQDLFYRLNVIQITIPPLRERPEDILPLAEFFLKKYAEKSVREVYGLDAKARELICKSPWHGNIRELENAIERAVALSSGAMLSRADFPATLARGGVLRQPGAGGFGDITLKALERIHIAATLDEHDWNYDLVTKILGIGRTTLWRKMKEYNITNGPAGA